MKKILVFMSILAVVFVPFLNVSKIGAWYYKPITDYYDFGFDKSKPLYFSGDKFYYDIVWKNYFFEDEWGNPVDFNLFGFIDYYFDNAEYVLPTNSYATVRLHINLPYVFLFDRYQQLIDFSALEGNQRFSYTDYVQYGAFKLQDISYVELSTSSNYDVTVGFKNAFSGGYALSFVVAEAGDNVTKMSRQYITNQEAMEFYGRDLDEYNAWHVNYMFNEGYDGGHYLGYLDGYEEGKNFGYNKGLDDGMLLGTDEGVWPMLFASLMAPFSLLSIELFKGVTIGMIVLVPIVFGLIAFLFKLGGRGK